MLKLKVSWLLSSQSIRRILCFFYWCLPLLLCCWKDDIAEDNDNFWPFFRSVYTWSAHFIRAEQCSKHQSSETSHTIISSLHWGSFRRGAVHLHYTRSFASCEPSASTRALASAHTICIWGNFFALCIFSFKKYKLITIN